MKDYIIWLKSGECIKGTAEENILNMLKERFEVHEEGKEVISFSDTEGKVFVNLDRIEAIAINEQVEEKQVRI